MKRNFLLLTFLALTPLYAYADFIPGRTRAAADGDLTLAQSDGRYQSVTGAHVQELITDGRGITQFHLVLSERSEITFKVTKIQLERCGRMYTAESANAALATKLQIAEVAPENCFQKGDITWRATLTTDEGGGKASHLVVNGTPKFYLLSQ